LFFNAKLLYPQGFDNSQKEISSLTCFYVSRSWWLGLEMKLCTF